MLQSSSSEKKLVKPLKKSCFFEPNLHRRGVIIGHAQGEKIFFIAEIKADHQLLESFYFIKIS